MCLCCFSLGGGKRVLSSSLVQLSSFLLSNFSIFAPPLKPPIHPATQPTLRLLSTSSSPGMSRCPIALTLVLSTSLTLLNSPYTFIYDQLSFQTRCNHSKTPIFLCLHFAYRFMDMFFFLSHALQKVFCELSSFDMKTALKKWQST